MTSRDAGNAGRIQDVVTTCVNGCSFHRSRSFFDSFIPTERRGEFFELIRKKQFNLEDPHQKELFLAMLMTACDLSAITKPWPIQQRIAELVATEFFDQGDKERKELNIEPTDLMNREKKNKIPSMQVGFIDAICLQLYEALTHVSEDCFPLLDGCRKNRQKWQALAEQQEKMLVNGASGQAKRS
ncbi:phosphodiesterase 5A [Rhinolophus ferrumequinum]|uniref:Phosphodiesterase 5A n=1 Tax=Rhinolophus ferrumequinum TaxID=59479 RepID=A0A7J7U214_RHIFE|nr:phosphodiesterase 5A [Rhinolophus ferrumequinum]